VDADDLQGIGAEALVRAALRYDPHSGVPFESFAFYRVRGAMIDGARSRDRSGRQHRRAQAALARSQDLLESAARDEARGAAADTRTLTERVAAAKRLVEKTAALALMNRTRIREVDQVARQSSEENDAEAALLKREQIERLRGLVEELPDGQRELVRAIYLEGETLTAFAEREGKNISTISRRHSKVLGILADKLRGPG
jgi:RNA polymerase sigma factor for flagellar operon FliA